MSLFVSVTVQFILHCTTPNLTASSSVSAAHSMGKDRKHACIIYDIPFYRIAIIASQAVSAPESGRSGSVTHVCDLPQ